MIPAGYRLVVEDDNKKHDFFPFANIFGQTFATTPWKMAPSVAGRTVSNAPSPSSSQSHLTAFVPSITADTVEVSA
jgi:hypothetical protein